MYYEEDYCDYEEINTDLEVAVFSKDKSIYLHRIREGINRDFSCICKQIFKPVKARWDFYNGFHLYQNLYEYEKNPSTSKPSLVRLDPSLDLYICIKPLFEDDAANRYFHSRSLSGKVQLQQTPDGDFINTDPSFHILQDFFMVKIPFLQSEESFELDSITPEVFELILSKDSFYFAFDLEEFIKQYKKGYCK